MAIRGLLRWRREMNGAEMGRASRARLRRAPTEIDIWPPSPMANFALIPEATNIAGAAAAR